MKFVRDSAPPDLPEPEGLEIVALGTGEGEDFGAIVAEGFGLPAWAGALFADLPGRAGWHCYVASVDARPRRLRSDAGRRRRRRVRPRRHP